VRDGERLELVILVVLILEAFLGCTYVILEVLV